MEQMCVRNWSRRFSPFACLPRPRTPLFKCGPSYFGNGSFYGVVPDLWSVKTAGEEVADLWERAVLESAQMESFHQDIDDEQPLDLSLKVKVVTAPQTQAPRSEGKAHGQEAPLCLIKDCGCSNHGPRTRLAGGTSVYDCGKYGPPVRETGGSAFSCEETLELRSDRFDSSRICYDQHCIPGRTGVESCWDPRRLPNEEERMDTDHLHPRFDKMNSVLDRTYRVPYRTCISGDLEKHTPHFTPSQPYYDSRDNNPQSFVDLSIVSRDCNWRRPHNNENKNLIRNWGDDPSRHMSRSASWSHAETNQLHNNPHWRPFMDTGRSSQETPMSEGRVAPKPSSVPLEKSSLSLPTSSNNVTPAPTGTPRAVCQSFASTVPLIPSSSTRREALHSSSFSTATKSGASMMVPRGPYTNIRVTRSPKTFHNQLLRNSFDADSRTCPFKRPQDSNKARGLAGKHGTMQEKENINTADSKGAPSEGVKMPALDYLISKVLVERIDIPFKACNTEIKKIYNGESKGRLRLVDLIELQVEESLKA